MQIAIWVSSISFHAYADIAFESTTDVSTLVLLLSLSLCIDIFCLPNSLISYAPSFLFIKKILLIAIIKCYKGGKGITDLKSALQVCVDSQFKPSLPV